MFRKTTLLQRLFYPFCCLKKLISLRYQFTGFPIRKQANNNLHFKDCIIYQNGRHLASWLTED